MCRYARSPSGVAAHAGSCARRGRSVHAEIAQRGHRVVGPWDRARAGCWRRRRAPASRRAARRTHPAREPSPPNVQRSRRRSTRTPLKKLTLGTMSRRSSPCLASATANRSRALGWSPCTPPLPYFASLRDARSTRRTTRRGLPQVSATIDRSTRPMSESSSDPAPRYACHCTFTVSATLSRSSGCGGVVHEQVGAGVALEVGEPDHRAARQHARRSPPGPIDVVPEQPLGRDRRPARSTTPTASAAGTVGWYATRRTPWARRGRGRRGGAGVGRRARPRISLSEPGSVSKLA